MNPEWDKLAEAYMGNNTERSDVYIAKLDGGIERKISVRYGIQAYPALLFFKKGESFPSDRFQGQRSLGEFKRWIETLAGPQAVVKPEPTVDNKDVQTGNKEDNKQPEKTVKPQENNHNNQPSKDQELQQQPSASNNDFHQHTEKILKKIEQLTHIVETHKSTDLKTMLTEINEKLTVKEIIKEEINFSHGIGFLILGLFLGVGISFTYINYKRLSLKKKVLD